MPQVHSHVDETGQDTKGDKFILGVVNINDDRSVALQLATRLELSTGRGRNKWIKTTDTKKLVYVKALLSTHVFKGCLYYAVYRNTNDFLTCTIAGTAAAIKAHASDSRALVRVDGLTKAQRNIFAVGLRRRAIATEKVRGVDDQGDALVRMADALCGFTRLALSEDNTFTQLLKNAERDGFIVRVT